MCYGLNCCNSCLSCFCSCCISKLIWEIWIFNSYWYCHFIFSFIPQQYNILIFFSQCVIGINFPIHYYPLWYYIPSPSANYNSFDLLLQNDCDILCTIIFHWVFEFSPIIYVVYSSLYAHCCNRIWWAFTAVLISLGNL